VIILPKISNFEVSSPVPVRSIRPDVIESNPTTDTPPTIPRTIALSVEEIMTFRFFEKLGLKEEKKITRKEMLVCRLIPV